MRIAQILPELNVGGVETGTVDLAKALKKRGHEPFVISNGGTLVDELVKAGIPHLQLPVHRKSIVSLRLVREIVTFIERERIDVIHARSRVPAWLAYLSVRRTDCDFVTTCHGYYSKHFLSRVMGWGKRVIVISHSIGRRMIDDFGVSPLRRVHELQAALLPPGFLGNCFQDETMRRGSGTLGCAGDSPLEISWQTDGRGRHGKALFRNRRTLAQ